MNPTDSKRMEGKEWKRLNAFAEGFLALINLLDESSHADLEVEWSGPWEVQRTTRPHPWGVSRWQLEEDSADDEQAPRERSPLEFDTWERALLAAAVLPIHARDPLIVEGESEGQGVDLLAYRPEGAFGVVGWALESNPDLLRALHVAEGLSRNPRSLAMVLEAAGPGGIRATGLYLARRLAARVRETPAQAKND